jgi:acetate kinase
LFDGCAHAVFPGKQVTSMAKRGSILTLNAGSSSLKFAVFDAASGLRRSAYGEVEKLDSSPRLRACDATGAVLAEHDLAAGQADRFAAALHAVLAFTDAHLGAGGLMAVGHRVVHGGAAHIGPELITPALIAGLRELTKLDPLHMPNNLAPMEAIAAVRPKLPQVACFDTAFHHTIPSVATQCALPREVSAAGVRRYGFHGLSYDYIVSCLKRDSPALACGRVIAAHLGSGASLCALQGGVSIATTMGLTALDGLVMATRCGSLDPGVILYLGREGHSFADIEDMLYRRSGLLGVSGISDDVRVLLASADPRAREAIDLFTYRIACEVGGLVSALGGLDGVVFTAGIGEHAPAIRAAVCGRLAWLGLRLDDAANAANARRISALDSTIDILVIPTDEELTIARGTQSVVHAGGASHHDESGPRGGATAQASAESLAR